MPHPRPALTSSTPHPGNPAERQAQADRVITRETKRLASRAERPGDRDTADSPRSRKSDP
jgi:hypothetical protein